MKYFSFFLLLISSDNLFAQTFTEIDFNIPGAEIGHVEWVDYDRDNDLDLFVEAGIEFNSSTIDSFHLFRNDGGVFRTRVLSIGTVYGDRFAWEDYDNDNDPDLIIVTISTAYTLNDGGKGIRIHENKGNGLFMRHLAALPYSYTDRWLWHDFDQDGDLDFFYSAYNLEFTGIWRNEGNDVFVEGNRFGSFTSHMFAIGDLNSDGLDDVICDDGSTVKIFYNNGEMNFSPVTVPLPVLYNGAMSLSDYNNDGLLDILACGNADELHPNSGSAAIYKNTGSSFTKIQTSFAKTSDGKISAADFDNDGDLDILITGRDSLNVYSSNLYRNDGNDQFSNFNLTLPGSAYKIFSVADFDNDRDLDILLSGLQSAAGVKILKNEIATANTLPASPTVLQANAAGDSIEFTWNAGSDSETPSSGLTYSLWIGNTQAKTNILSPSASTSTGQRFLSGQGNMGAKKKYVVHGLPNGTYYWGVQCVDHGFAGSGFSAVQTVSVSSSSINTYSNINAAIAGIAEGMSAWGDYDGDGDLDVVVTGYDAVNNKMTAIYRNDNGVFVDINAGLLPLAYSGAAWGDMDNDGDLDLAVSGFSDQDIAQARVYRNGGGDHFTDTGLLTEGSVFGSVLWGDYDNDGFQDLFIGGSTSVTSYGHARLYRNIGGGSMSNVKIFSGVGMERESSLAVGDYDGDGDLDMALGNGWRNQATRIYRNDGNNIFTEYAKNFTEMKDWRQAGPVSWHDIDMDGDLDLLAERIFFKNANAAFTDSTILPINEIGIHSSWTGDADSDGDPDVLVSGVLNGRSLPGVQCLQNAGGSSFTDIPVSFPPVYVGSISGGDYDNDGDMDLMLSGYDLTSTKVCNIYERTGSANIKPLSPQSLASSVNNGVVRMSWLAGSDAETPSSGLGYNVFIGTSPDLQNARSAQANLATGLRYVPEPGNAQTNLFSFFKSPVSGTYYWSVQSVDQSYAGSAFAPVQSFHLEAIPSPRPSVLDFGDIKKDTVKTMPLTIINTGNIALSIWLLSVPDTLFWFPSVYETIASGDSLQFEITFSARAEGKFNSVLTFEHNGIPGTLAVPLTASVPVTPKVFALTRNYPNPFNLGTQIEMEIPVEARAVVMIYDLLGREVATLYDGIAPVGFHLLHWDAANAATGVYICRMQVGNISSVRKLMLMK